MFCAKGRQNGSTTVVEKQAGDDVTSRMRVRGYRARAQRREKDGKAEEERGYGDRTEKR